MTDADRNVDAGVDVDMRVDVSGDEEAGFLRATRESYDAIAEDFAEAFPSDGLGRRPRDRALICGFAERSRGGEASPSPTWGAGPGR
ncbi:hypothetical protein [Streptomyces sp. NBC_01235]|uniref:hypothetical protein n=1 Tax=Streptomyces sp. NBC_01235 TaxID=2903788 RepID=UPI002E0E72A7